MRSMPTHDRGCNSKRYRFYILQVLDIALPKATQAPEQLLHKHKYVSQNPRCSEAKGHPLTSSSPSYSPSTAFLKHSSPLSPTSAPPTPSAALSTQLRSLHHPNGTHTPRFATSKLSFSLLVCSHSLAATSALSTTFIGIPHIAAQCMPKLPSATPSSSLYRKVTRRACSSTWICMRMFLTSGWKANSSAKLW